SRYFFPGGWAKIHDNVPQSGGHEVALGTDASGLDELWFLGPQTNGPNDYAVYRRAGGWTGFTQGYCGALWAGRQEGFGGAGGELFVFHDEKTGPTTLGGRWRDTGHTLGKYEDLSVGTYSAGTAVNDEVWFVDQQDKLWNYKASSGSGLGTFTDTGYSGNVWEGPGHALTQLQAGVNEVFGVGFSFQAQGDNQQVWELADKTGSFSLSYTGLAAHDFSVGRDAQGKDLVCGVVNQYLAGGHYRQEVWVYDASLYGSNWKDTRLQLNG